MLGRTHIPAGITAAILMTQPSDAVGLTCAVSGGAIGGWICDIDCLNSSRKEGAVFGGVLALLLTAGMFFFDSTHGGVLINYFSAGFGKKMLTGAAVMLICCIVGFISSHRTFTHSALGLILMSQAVALICPPLASAFTAGAASHILLDLFNKKDVLLLYPLKKGVSLGVCTSDGKINHLLTAIFTATSAGLIILCTHGLLHSGFQAVRDTGVFYDILPQISSFLVFVNSAVLIVSGTELLARKTHISHQRSSDSRTLTLALCALGGGLGMIASSAVMTILGKRFRLSWWLTALFSSAFWGGVYLIAEDPLGFQLHHDIVLHIFIWLGSVNIAAALLGFFHRKRKLRKLSRLVSFAGGGAGTLLGLAVSGKRVSDRSLPVTPLLTSAVLTAAAYLFAAYNL